MPQTITVPISEFQKQNSKPAPAAPPTPTAAPKTITVPKSVFQGPPNTPPAPPISSPVSQASAAPAQKSPEESNATPSGDGYPRPTVPGNIQWYNRPAVSMPGGKYGTVYSSSREENGMEVIYPLIYDGKVHSDDEAWQHYKQTGQHMGKFSGPEAKRIADADAYAQKYHEDADAGKYGKVPSGYERPSPETSPPPPVYPGPPKDFEDSVLRREKDDWEDRQSGFKEREAVAAREHILAKNEESKGKLLDNFVDAANAWKKDPSPENYERAQKAGDLFYGRRLEEKVTQYKPSKQETEWRVASGVPVDVPYSQLTDEQKRAYGMAVSATLRQEQQKNSAAIRHIDQLIANAGKGAGSKEEKDYLAYRYKAAKTRLSSLQSDMYALENDKTSDTGDEKTAKLTALQGQREQIHKEVDDLANQVLNPTHGSADPAAAIEAARDKLISLGIKPKGK